jgi:hypothetical protein
MPLALNTLRSAQPLETLLHDRLIYIHSSAKVDDKQSIIGNIIGRSVVYRTFEVSDVRFITVDANTILRTGRMKIQITAAGVDKGLHVAFIEGWTRSGGDWQLISWQSTTVPA